jgi:hypothetical protein
MHVLHRCHQVRAEIQMQTGMLSTMEFNMDGTVLATAGVSKCIKIMDAEAVKRGDVASAVSDPDIVTRAKLSSLSWNKFIKHHLVCPQPLSCSRTLHDLSSCGSFYRVLSFAITSINVFCACWLADQQRF